MSLWFKIVLCPYCNTQREIKISQKRCKCPNCKEFYNIGRLHKKVNLRGKNI